MKKTRIAPTPSGYLHAGNAFNFLVADRLAKATGGRLLLRIDDLDGERARPEYIEDIFRSLEWLRIQVDEGPSGPADFEVNWSQRLRIERYVAVAQELRAFGVLYPCPCSRPRFEAVGRVDHACRNTPDTLAANGTPWRLRIPDPHAVSVRELDGTSLMVDLAAIMPDPAILQRDTGRPAYQIASLCDDLDMGISFIVRGADLLPSTACQVHLAEVLQRDGFSGIAFHHHALTLAPDGTKLSKSAGGASLKAMREAGISPDAMIAQAGAYSEALLSRIRL